MRKLVGFLKPYAATVVAIIAVLMLQAFCDLSLPSYTSDIVNVGIQQGGIDTSLPEQIAVEDMEKLLLFVSEEGKSTVLDAYEKDDEAYSKPAYVLKEDASGEEEMSKLLEVMGKPMLIVQGFDSDSAQMEEMKKGLLAGMPEGMAGVRIQIFLRF